LDKAQDASRIEILRQVWSDGDIIPRSAKWRALKGGRSNPIWHVHLGDGAPDLVCKLFTPNTSTPLFANDGPREALALAALEGTGIAPSLVAIRDCVLGESIVYQYLTGAAWRGDITGAAQLMAQLHKYPPPNGLPEKSVTVESLLVDGHRISQESNKKMPAPPDVKTPPPARRAFLHGDIVPGNLLITDDGMRLIDWQCPAIGDPSDDIAIFLSPAMQVIYGHRVLSAVECTTFLNAYDQASGECTSTSRYRTLAPLYHWRMATYCLWKGDRGEGEYTEAAALEFAALEQC